MKLLLPLTAVLLAGVVRLPAEDETVTRTTTTQTEGQNGDYRVMKICQSEYALKTEDGADAGRIEYVVVDPSEGRIVSAVISGGVLADRFVAVPYASIHLGPSHEVVLTHVDRVHLMDAPVIQRERIVNVNHFAPDLVRNTYTHFGIREEDVRHGRAPQEERTQARDPEFKVGRAEQNNAPGNRQNTERQNQERMKKNQQSPRDERDQNSARQQQREGNRNEEARPENGQTPRTDRPQADREEHGRKSSKTEPRSNNSANANEGKQRPVEGPRDEAAPKPGDRAQDAPPNAQPMKKEQSSDSPPSKKSSDLKNEEQSGSGKAAHTQKKAEQEESRTPKASETPKTHEKKQPKEEQKEATSPKSRNEEAAPQKAKPEARPSASEQSEGQPKARKGEGKSEGSAAATRNGNEEGKAPHKPKKPDGE